MAVAKASFSLQYVKVCPVDVDSIAFKVIDPRINFVSAARKTNDFEYRTFLYRDKLYSTFISCHLIVKKRPVYSVDKIILSSGHKPLELYEID